MHGFINLFSCHYSSPVRVLTFDCSVYICALRTDGYLWKPKKEAKNHCNWAPPRGSTHLNSKYKYVYIVYMYVITVGVLYYLANSTITYIYTIYIYIYSYLELQWVEPSLDVLQCKIWNATVWFRENNKNIFRKYLLKNTLWCIYYIMLFEYFISL